MSLFNRYYHPYESARSFIDICSLIAQTTKKVQWRKVTRLTDLPNEILLIICEYLRPVDVLRAFLSSDTSDRLHRLIIDYRTHIDLSELSYTEFRYMMDTVLPQLDPSNLRLSNLQIPCLIDQFIESWHQFSSMKINSLELDGCINLDHSFMLWLSRQSRLKALYFDETNQDKSISISADLVTLRNFLFVDGLPSSVEEIYFQTTCGLILHNGLKSSTASGINDASLNLDTIDDLQLLLNKGLLGNVSKLQIHLKNKQKGFSQQKSSLFLHKHLLEFSLREYDTGITSEELPHILRHMPVLQKFSLYLDQTPYTVFARSSYFDGILPHSIIEFRYLARFRTSMSNTMEADLDTKNNSRFPMEMHDNMIYTLPWQWLKRIPSDGDNHRLYTNKKKSLYLSSNRKEISMEELKSWYHVTKIESNLKLPSLELFCCLRSLKTTDPTVVYSALPSTLRLLELTNHTPLDLNVPLSPIVHSQVNKLILKCQIRDEQDLLNILYQFPNLRFLSLHLPTTNSKDYLFHIFQNNNARLPHLISLEVYGGEYVSWFLKPFEWLIIYTPLKYRSTPFYAIYYHQTKRLIIWL